LSSQSYGYVKARPTAAGRSAASDSASERFHHTGYVVASIAEVIESFCIAIGGSGWSETWHDPIQRVRVAFIYSSQPGDPSVELVEPAGPGSPVEKFLEHGGGLHHVCYEVGDMEETMRIAPSRGLTVIRRPQPAVAFGGRRIAWVITRERLLIEYLEKTGDRASNSDAARQ
jgi:methylmalonyl-CoA/ethylmalonyl-CoA epimerase